MPHAKDYEYEKINDRIYFDFFVVFEMSSTVRPVRKLQDKNHYKKSISKYERRTWG